MAESAAKRKTWLDLLRILASFLVCFIHADGYQVFLYQEPDGSRLSWIFVLICVACRICIPLFLMITGALMLKRQEPWSVILKKRVFRFAVLLVAVSSVMFTLKHWGSFRWDKYVQALLGGSIVPSYWYLYAYLAFLLMLPFLRRIAAGITFTDIAVLTVIRLVMTSLVPLANYWLPVFGGRQFYIHSDFQVPMAMMNVVFYPLLGHYLANVYSMENFGKKQLGLCAAAYLLQLVIPAVTTYHEGVHAQFTQNHLNLFEYVGAIVFFLLARYLLEKVSFPERFVRAAASLSSCSLGIYLLEPILSHFLYNRCFGMWYFMQLPEDRMALSAVYGLMIMTLGCIITWLIRRIPGGKKFL